MAKRKIPTSLKDYARSFTQVKEVATWVRKEIIDKESLPHIYRTIIFSFCLIFFQALLPIGFGRVLSSAFSKSFHGLIMGFGLIAICFVAQKIFDRYMARAREWILAIHWTNLDKRMTELFFEKSPGQHIQESILTPSSIDKGRWNLLMVQGLVFFDAVPAVAQLTISLSLILIKGVDAGSFMVLAVVAYLIFSLYLNFHVMRECTPIDRSMRRLNRRRIERMEKATRVIVSSQEKREVEEMTEWHLRDTRRDLNFWLWFIEKGTWRSLINIALFLAVLGYSARLVWIGRWEAGALVPIYSWATRIIENIWQLGAIEHKINWSLPSIRAMIQALSLPPDVVDASDAVALCHCTPQRIVFENISHSYPAEIPHTREEEEDEEEDDDKKKSEEVPPTLKKVSFTIEPGEKVAIIGPSGAGKSSLMRLLLRFMDPTEGSISVNGHDLRQVAKNSWMRSIGYIAQSPEVFDGTIRDNLTYRLSHEERDKITDSDLWELMRTLEIDFGKRLDQGLETRVGKHGLKLSGGQAQRLMIGAAVIGNPWLMIIDEATSSLDSTTERKVQHGLEKVLSGKTSAVIIAHRLSTVRLLCSKFVVLKPSHEVQNGDSQVEAIGCSFEELYEVSPTFRRLADDQEVHI